MTFQAAALRDKLAGVPVIKSGLSLMTGTMVTSALGLLFWILAANLYDAADFGVSTTAVYTMMMLADVACIGLRTGLARYLPTAGTATRRTIVWGYGIVLAASSVTALTFLAGLQLWAPDLVELRNGVLIAIFFIASTAFWALFMLEDAVLVGLRKAPWVPIENTLFGVLKILLLIPFASISPTLGIFWAWTLPVFPIVIGINVLISRLTSTSALAGDGGPVAAIRSLLRGIIAFSLADWLAALARLVALGVIPLMVLAQTDRAQAGYFQASWLIAFTIMALSSNAAYALLAESSYDQAKLHKNSFQAGLLSLALTVPVMLVGFVGARYLLLIYGSDYADNSANVLRILLVAAIPNVLYQIFIGRLRVRGRMVGVVVFETILSVIVVGLSWLLLPRYGINAVGIAWLVGLTVLATYAAISESIWLWASHLDTNLVRRVGSGLRRARSGRPTRGMDARLSEVMAREGLAATAVHWLPSGDHGQTAIVGIGENDNLDVTFARSPEGAAKLARESEVLGVLSTDPALFPIAGILPTLKASGADEGREYTVVTKHDGPIAADLIRGGVPVDVVCRSVLEPVSMLHRATARSVVVDEDHIADWIDESRLHLASQGRASELKLGLLGDALRAALVGATIEVGRIQGSLGLDNIVMTADPIAVSEIRHWEWSREMPVAVDAATLTLSCLSLRGHLELGELVRQLLADPTPFEQHPAMAATPASTVSSRALILLTWLQIVGRPLPPSRTMSSDVFWLARNAQPVLAALSPPVGSNR